MADIGKEQGAFYGRAIEESISLAVTATSAQVTPRLVPGRYLLVLRATTDTDWFWVRVDKWVDGATITALAAAGPKQIPMNRLVHPTFEFVVVRNISDRIAAIAEGAGSGTLHICRVSRKV